MRNGDIVEMGLHNQLVAAGGEYSGLVNMFSQRGDGDNTLHKEDNSSSGNLGESLWTDIDQYVW